MGADGLLRPRSERCDRTYSAALVDVDGDGWSFVKEKKLYSITAAGRELHQITFGTDADQQPSWHP